MTKSQAIQRLLPQIRASQSKGYTLAEIGRVLTERGIPVTTGALRAHVSGATARPEGKKKRRPNEAGCRTNASTAPRRLEGRRCRRSHNADESSPVGAAQDDGRLERGA